MLNLELDVSFLCCMCSLFSAGWIMIGELSDDQTGGACHSCKQWSDGEAG